MPYRYLENIATADIAFDAWANTVEELFIESADALLNVMVEDLDSIRNVESKSVQLSNDALDFLLFDVLQEIIYYKDAARLLLRLNDVEITNNENLFGFKAIARGEPICQNRHKLAADVKAVTFHDFAVSTDGQLWSAHVILDI
ncbi:MAG TPA: archease [Chitinispirillaceae bacterium]|nr:archease [Chitinispirillaceae bacterium]